SAFIFLRTLCSSLPSRLRPPHHLSSRPERPDFFFRAVVRRVGPRSGGNPPRFQPITSLSSLCSLRSSLRLPRAVFAKGDLCVYSPSFSIPKNKNAPISRSALPALNSNF